MQIQFIARNYGKAVIGKTHMYSCQTLLARVHILYSCQEYSIFVLIFSSVCISTGLVSLDIREMVLTLCRVVKLAVTETP